MAINIFKTTDNGRARLWVAVPTDITVGQTRDVETLKVDKNLGAILQWDTEDEMGALDASVSQTINRLIAGFDKAVGIDVNVFTEKELRKKLVQDYPDHVVFELFMKIEKVLTIETIVEVVTKVPDGEGGFSDQAYPTRQPSPLGSVLAVFKTQKGFEPKLNAIPSVNGIWEGEVLTHEDIVEACADALSIDGGLEEPSGVEIEIVEAVFEIAKSKNDYNPLTMDDYSNTLALVYRHHETVLDTDLDSYTESADDDDVRFTGFRTFS